MEVERLKAFENYIELSEFLESQCEKFINYASMNEAVEVIVRLFKEFYKEAYLEPQLLVALNVLINDFLYNEGFEVVLDQNNLMEIIKRQDCSD